LEKYIDLIKIQFGDEHIYYVEALEKLSLNLEE
jgi:hypothetical protein